MKVPRPRRVLALAAGLGLAGASASGGAQPSMGAPIVVERTIPLPGVEGRIDHLAADAKRRRVFVAELGNGSVEAVDLDTGRRQRVTGLKEPQGLAFLQARNELAVASGGDGTVRFLDADTLAERGRIPLGDDADNIRIVPCGDTIVVGYGSGALAVIDPATRRVVRSVALPAHPESFQITADGRRAFVNLPDAHRIAVVDLQAGKVTATWSATYGSNFPMAYDGRTVAVVYRRPARLVLLEAVTGAVRQDIPACADADDVFFDDRRDAIYVSCGAGTLDVFARQPHGYARVGEAETRSGARTALFVPELDRLVVAARAGYPGGDAALLIFRPRA
jgi:hypothetical protein